MRVLALVRDYIHSLVHPAARCHAPTAARHYAFMAPRVIGGLSAIAGLPGYLALRGAPSAIEAVAQRSVFAACDSQSVSGAPAQFREGG